MVESVFIGFGSNMGDRFDLCERAVTLLALLPETQVTGLSSLYETEPVPDVGDPGPGSFLNGVLRLETSLPPDRLLDACREIEEALGRDQTHRRGPRTMDIDLLSYGDRVFDDGRVQIPHPRLHVRRFVLTPLAELDPAWSHPVLHRSAKELLAQLDDAFDVRRLDVALGSSSGPLPSCHTRSTGA